MPRRFIRLAPLLTSLLLSGTGWAETAWFISSPAGVPAGGKTELRLPAEGPWEMAEELDRLGRRGEVPPLAIDLERRQIVGRSGPFRLQMGQQALAGESLILRGLQRRGFSLNVQGGPQAAGVTGFVVQGQPTSLQDDRLGLADPENRISGVAGQIAPVKSGPVQVNISAAYLSGQRPGLSAGDPQQGEAWTAAAEAGLWKHLTLRGEVAGSRYAPGQEWDDREGQAFSLLARYNSVFHPKGAPPVEWHLGAESQQVDPLFYSLGNTGFGADRERFRLFGGARQDKLLISGSAGRERSNIEDNPRLATVERFDYLLQLQYDLRRPAQTLPWLGSPRYSLIFDGFRRRPIDSSAPSSTQPADDQKRLQCRVDFSREGWQWGAGYRISHYLDHADIQDDNRHRAVDLRAEVRLGDRISFFPTAEFGTTFIHGDEVDTARLGLRGKAILVPDWLRTGWDLSLSRDENVGGGWERNTVLAGDLTYTLRSPREGRAGFELALSGSRRERENSRAWLDRREYLLYLALTMTLPPAPG